MIKLFEDVINKRVTRILLEPIAVEFEINNTEVFHDFIYIETGSVYFELEGKELYNIGSINSTKLATDFIGIVNQTEKLNQNLKTSLYIPDLDKYLGSKILSIELNWNKEGWSNDNLNELYIESCILNFSNNCKLIIFAGEYESLEKNENTMYNLLAGRSSVILFMDQEKFNKYGKTNFYKVELIK